VAGGGWSGSSGGQGKGQGEREQGGEKRKKKKTMAKVVIDDDEVVEVAGPSGSRSGFNTGPFLERMDRLTAAVEAMTRQMAWIMDSTWSVLWSNDCLSAGLETFLEECHFFMAPWDEDEESEDSEAEVDPEEVEQEVQGLHEEQENPDSAVPE